MAIHWRKASNGQEHWLMHWRWLKSDHTCSQANICWQRSLWPQPETGNLGKVNPTFPAALFSVDARFARKIERPQKGIKWPVTAKQTQANEGASSEHNIQSKKTCKYVYQAHTNCLKLACFWKLVIIQLQIKILSEGLWR